VAGAVDHGFTHVRRDVAHNSGFHCPERFLAANSERLWCKTAANWDDEQIARFLPVEELFKGRHFGREIVVLCVRWYLSFKLSYRDLVGMMIERGIELAHTTIMRWVLHYTPEFEKRWNRYARSVGGSWRCDETYIDVYKGEGRVGVPVPGGR
jgi:hypothetical protein